jgi:hypothetical protein
MTEFYRFGWAQQKNEILIESISEYSYEDLVTGRTQLNGPFETRIAEGKKLYDIVHFEDPCNFSISEKVHAILREIGATGWKSYDISIRGIKAKYYGFQITGRCGPLVRPQQAGFVQGFEFDIASWDGSDFFYPEGTLGFFCTRRIKELFSAKKITNLKLDRSDLVKWYSV